MGEESPNLRLRVQELQRHKDTRNGRGHSSKRCVTIASAPRPHSLLSYSRYIRITFRLRLQTDHEHLVNFRLRQIREAYLTPFSGGEVLFPYHLTCNRVSPLYGWFLLWT